MAADAHLIKTYRFLRLAMVVLVVMLLASVAIEIIQAGGCLRTSISSYYFTPARGVFIGSLVAVGACLVILKGNTELSDILLNIAGLLAAVVAFVPIADPHECSSAAVGFTDSRANVFNNVTALAVAGLLTLAITIGLARRDRAGAGRIPVEHVIGISATLAFGGLLLALFIWARDFFDAKAHYIAAIPLFILLIAVMVVEAFSFGRTTGSGRYTNRYGYIAGSTLAVVAVLLVAQFTLHWAGALFWIEVAVILAFGTFWVTQTIELWEADEGVRPDPEGVASEPNG